MSPRNYKGNDMENIYIIIAYLYIYKRLPQSQMIFIMMMLIN